MVHDDHKKDTPFDGYYAFSILNNMDKIAWAIDSSASVHICCTPELLYTTYKLEKPVDVRLPDGSSKRVACEGKVKL